MSSTTHRTDPRRPPLAAAPPPARVVERVVERVDQRLVDQAVAHLRRVLVAGQVQTMAEAGEYLIENFYGGLDNARSRVPHKPASLAQLAARAEEFGMTAATLRYVVPMALAVRELGAPLAGKLGVTRLRALLPIKDSEQRGLLAETAVSSEWTVDKLKVRVRQIHKPHAGGRRQLPGVERAVERIARVADTEATPERLREGLDALTPAHALRLLARADRLGAQVERVRKALLRAAAKAPAKTTPAARKPKATPHP